MDNVNASGLSARYTDEEKENYIIAWQQSKLSKQAFGDKVGINVNTFKSWVTKKNKKSMPVSPAAEKEIPFVAIQLDNNKTPRSATSSPLMEINLPGGGIISIYQPVPIEYLRELLK